MPAVLLLHRRGFSFIELVAVLLIASMLFVFAVGTHHSPHFNLQTSKRDVVATIMLARQLAMARTVPGIQVVLEVVDTGLLIREESSAGRVLLHDSVLHTLVLPEDIRVIAGTGRVSFDALGATTATNLILASTDEVSTVVINELAYVYAK
ncbi:MAG: prepilin-type N-terminal cleavage/methylation domain-containing protein [Cellvibrionaceae bacterium]|nr:prepilin-type N-terminal cleavage/methylation domain-containing protein [Cellvibrionaceae bacterium]